MKKKIKKLQNELDNQKSCEIDQSCLITAENLEYLWLSDLSQSKLIDPIFVPGIGTINKSELQTINKNIIEVEDRKDTSDIPYYEIQFIEEVIKLSKHLNSSNKPSENYIKDKKLKTMSEEIKSLKSQIGQKQQFEKNKKSTKSLK